MHLQLIRQQPGLGLALPLALSPSLVGLPFAICWLPFAPVSRFYGLPTATPTWQLIDIVYRFTSNKFHFPRCIVSATAWRFGISA